MHGGVTSYDFTTSDNNAWLVYMTSGCGLKIYPMSVMCTLSELIQLKMFIRDIRDING